METTVKYAYYYHKGYGVFFIRRLDGDKLNGNIPEGLYNACLMDYTMENREYISLSNFRKALSFSADDTMAMIDFKLRSIGANEREDMFNEYRRYNNMDEDVKPKKTILNGLKK